MRPGIGRQVKSLFKCFRACEVVNRPKTEHGGFMNNNLQGLVSDMRREEMGKEEMPQKLQ